MSDILSALYENLQQNGTIVSTKRNRTEVKRQLNRKQKVFERERNGNACFVAQITNGNFLLTATVPALIFNTYSHLNY